MCSGRFLFRVLSALLVALGAVEGGRPGHIFDIEGILLGYKGALYNSVACQT